MAEVIALALELSQRDGGIALQVADGTCSSAEVATGDRDRDVVMPAIDELVRGAGLAPRDLEAVIVSVGPGGFTGLRIAVATAKALALSTGAALVAVESASVAAATHGGEGVTLVVSAAKGGTFWLSKVVAGEGTWQSSGALADADVLRDMLSGVKAVLADEFMPEAAADACSELGVTTHGRRQDPLALLSIGCTRLAAGKTIEAADLLPLYPREPEAVRRWREAR